MDQEFRLPEQHRAFAIFEKKDYLLHFVSSASVWIESEPLFLITTNPKTKKAPSKEFRIGSALSRSGLKGGWTLKGILETGEDWG